MSAPCTYQMFSSAVSKSNYLKGNNFCNKCLNLVRLYGSKQNDFNQQTQRKSRYQKVTSISEPSLFHHQQPTTTTSSSSSTTTTRPFHGDFFTLFGWFSLRPYLLTTIGTGSVLLSLFGFKKLLFKFTYKS